MKSLRKLAAVALLGLLFPLAGAADASAGQGANSEATFTITFENITTGQYVTPPNFALHTTAVDVFGVGQAASPALQQLAENGDVLGFAAELAAIDAAGLGVSGVGAAAPLAPGASSTTTVTGVGSRLSLAAMLICTNDGFAGLDSRPLPVVDGQSRTYLVRGFDAGTEINTELRSDLVPAPFCGPGAGTGASNPELAENGVIRPHRTLRGVGDIDAALDWQGPVMRVTVTRN